MSPLHCVDAVAEGRHPAPASPEAVEDGLKDLLREDARVFVASVAALMRTASTRKRSLAPPRAHRAWTT
jgi:predicted dinucleotide-utilizing enzyme